MDNQKRKFHLKGLNRQIGGVGHMNLDPAQPVTAPLGSGSACNRLQIHIEMVRIRGIGSAENCGGTG